MTTLIFCAFGAEFAPLRARLENPQPIPGFRGVSGRLAGVEVAVIVSGVGVKRAQHSAALAFDRFPQVKRAILTGVAGALHGDLQIGDLVVAERLWMRHADEFAIADELPVAEFVNATAALQAAQIAYLCGPLLTSRKALLEAADKKRMFDALGAVAVDMESAVIATEAHQRGIPFICLRTILDTAAQDLTPALLADENGRVRPLKAATAFARNPRLFAASLQLLRNLKSATASMAAAIEAVVRNGE